jgi:hypothetical protein
MNAEPSTSNSLRRRLRVVVLAIVISIPLLRLFEAVGRLAFLPDYYTSLWDALISEMWFTDMWSLYTATWFGWWAFRLQCLWLLAVPVVLWFPAVPNYCRGGCCVASVFLYLVCLGFIEATSHFDPVVFNGKTEREMVWSLRSQYPVVRRKAAAQLQHHYFKFGLPAGTGELVRGALTDEDVEVRRFAASFLVKHWSIEATQELTIALNDEDATVRQDAAKALSARGR